jgi:hypothetical protein
VITGDGGTCVFYASYDVQQKIVLDFDFGSGRYTVE